MLIVGKMQQYRRMYPSGKICAIICIVLTDLFINSVFRLLITPDMICLSLALS